MLENEVEKQMSLQFFYYYTFYNYYLYFYIFIIIFIFITIFVIISFCHWACYVSSICQWTSHTMESLILIFMWYFWYEVVIQFGEVLFPIALNICNVSSSGCTFNSVSMTFHNFISNGQSLFLYPIYHYIEREMELRVQFSFVSI